METHFTPPVSCHPHIIRVVDSKKEHLLRLAQQVYLKADGSTTTFVNMDDKQLTICHNLGYFEALLPPCFVRVHKSYIISLHYLLSIRKDHTLKLDLPGHPCIPLSLSYRPYFEEALEKWNWAY